MLTVWIVPHSNPALSDIFDGAGWRILESKVNKWGQRWMPEPDVIIYDVGQGPLDDTFQAYRLAHLAPLLALATDWETARQAWCPPLNSINDATVLCPTQAIEGHVRQLIVRSRLFITLGAWLLMLLLSACVPTQARYPQAIEGSPTAMLTAQPVPVEPMALPTVQPTSVPSPTPTAIPTVSPTALGDLSWLTPQPPTEIAWKEYVGKFEEKNSAFSYQLSYPIDWIVYPHDSTVQIQTFAQFETVGAKPAYKCQAAYRILAWENR